MSNRLLLVDALNLIRRVYAAQPGEDGAERAEGARTSCEQSLRRALKECEPTHTLVVFEGAGPTWRHELFPEYKLGHKPMPGALQETLASYREAFARFGVPSFSMANQEADDVIATLAVKMGGARAQAAILSTDKSFLQLLSEYIHCRDHFKRENLEPPYVVRKFGVAPERFADYLALTGDSGNGIHGVAGVGPKTATRLIDVYGTVGRVLEAAQDDSSPDLSSKLAERLRAGAGDARLALRLVRLRTDLDLGLNLRDLRYRH